MKKERITRKESRMKLEGYQLSCLLARVIRRFFPKLCEALNEVRDPRNQSYITYSNRVIMMTRILSAIFYISSMRKSSEELNASMVINNIGQLCHEELEEIPYWETINHCLKRIDPSDLQATVHKMVNYLIRCHRFEEARIQHKYWQLILDATKLIGSKEELDGNYTFCVHNKGKENEYTEYSYYVLEVKLALRDDVYVSIMSEFIENKDEEYVKQDCERSAAVRVMERIKKSFPRLPICISGDSLYACAPFFKACEEYGWTYLVRFKRGSIPTVQKEYESLKENEKNQRTRIANGITQVHDFVNKIDYNGILVNFAHYSETAGNGETNTFNFLTNLPVNQKNIERIIAFGRRRWAIENRGFNDQKNHGYYIEHLFSKNCRATKNHYYLIQIAHMISQIMDAWMKIWSEIKLSKEQRHKRLLESWKTQSIESAVSDSAANFQIRFE